MELLCIQEWNRCDIFDVLPDPQIDLDRQCFRAEMTLNFRSLLVELFLERLIAKNLKISILDLESIKTIYSD